MESLEMDPNELTNLNQILKDLIIQWFTDCHNATGAFPNYPEGGVLFIFSENDPQYLKIELALREDSKTEPEKSEKELDEMEMFEVLYELEMGEKNYERFWKDRKKSKIFSETQKVDLEQHNVVAEMTVKVDEKMRQEFDELKRYEKQDPQGNGEKVIVTLNEHMRQVLDELNCYLDPKQKSAGKKKGGKKDKKGGKKGKKKGKDLTAERTLESLCEELTEQSFLKQARAVSIEDYYGNFSCLMNVDAEDPPESIIQLPNIRHVLSLYAALAFESELVHEDVPQVKAVLLAGPPGVGKKMLVHAVCHETGATLFDLSPKNTAGKYPGNPGLALMIHMVFKVAKLRQPSVIWIGEVEKLFYKKVPKEEKKLNPKRLKKPLAKAIKQIQDEDNILIIGTANDPKLADKTLSKTFDQIVLVPPPNYTFRRILWRKIIKKHGGEITVEELSSLAYISDGFNQSQIVQLVETVLTRQRVQGNTPLMAEEFVPLLAKLNPVREAVEKMLIEWYQQTPHYKKRKEVSLSKEEPSAKAKDKGGK